MRKLVLCVLMTTLLAGCGQPGVSEAEELALTIRGEYLAMDRCAVQVSVTADYGQRVYQYELAAAVSGEETVLTLSAPETVAGLTARITGEDSRLARSGYITACALEEEDTLLRVDCGDPAGSPGSGTETVLWFDASTHALVRGEVSVDGFRVVLCEVTHFTPS